MAHKHELGLFATIVQGLTVLFSLGGAFVIGCFLKFSEDPWSFVRAYKLPLALIPIWAFCAWKNRQYHKRLDRRR